MSRSSSSNWTAIRVISISSSAKNPDKAQTVPARREMALGLACQAGPGVIGWQTPAVSSAFIWGRPGGTCVSEGAGPRGTGPLVRLSHLDLPQAPASFPAEAHRPLSRLSRGLLRGQSRGLGGAYRRGPTRHHGCHFISNWSEYWKDYQARRCDQSAARAAATGSRALSAPLRARDSKSCHHQAKEGDGHRGVEASGGTPAWCLKTV